MERQLKVQARGCGRYDWLYLTYDKGTSPYLQWVQAGSMAVLCRVQRESLEPR